MENWLEDVNELLWLKIKPTFRLNFELELDPTSAWLACIFQQSPSSGDRKRCSLVRRRWLKIEVQSRHRLSLSNNSISFFTIWFLDEAWCQIKQKSVASTWPNHNSLSTSKHQPGKFMA